MRRPAALLLPAATAAIVAGSLLPFLWFVAASLKTEIEITAIPPVLIPSGTLRAYTSAIGSYGLLHYLGNSVIVAGATTLVTISLAVLAGYALARLRLAHRGLIMGSLLLVSMSSSRAPKPEIDERVRAAMRIELARLHRQLGTTMVYVTHDQVEAMTLGEKIVVFDRGTIQQIGPPQEIYDRPANLTVATFVGSPRINLLEGGVVTRGERLDFEAGGVSFPLPVDRGYEACAGRQAVLAVRPEALILGDGPVRGAVEHVEDLGAERILYLPVGAERWAARVPRGTMTAPGREVSFAVHPDGLHLFVGNQRFGQTPRT